MELRFSQICFLCMYFIYIQGIQLSSEDSGYKAMLDRQFKNPHSKSSIRNSQRILDRRMIPSEDSLNQDRDDIIGQILARIARMEGSQDTFIQTSQETQNRVIEMLENMNRQMKKSGAQYDQIQKVVKSLNDKVESMMISPCSAQDPQTASNQLQEDIQDIKRSASLLAITEIKLAELPYNMDCEINRSFGDMETYTRRSYMDDCIETRLEELYSGFSDMLDFHVMLVGGSGPHEGRVEILYHGRHGTICSRYWDIRDATVVCKMIGYERARRSYKGSHFGNGTEEILLDAVECKGKERSLLSCKHRGIGANDDVSFSCHHGNDAGVTCKL